MTKISFELFVGVWNAQQGHDTPQLHRRMAAWVSAQSRSQQKRLLLMAFRGSGKSTLVGLFCAWLLTHDPDLRILVVSADESLAEHLLRHVRGILETHPLTRGLLPVKRTEWAVDRITIKRNRISRDPSLRAAGIASNITGNRADIIICDDVEVPKTCDSAWKREQLRARLNELDFILTPGGMTLYIGTPHAEDSLYKTDGFLKHHQRLEIPLDDTAWPQRFSSDTISKIKASVGPRVFASQMLLQNVSLHDVTLDAIQIGFYDGEPSAPIIAKRCYWDPAFGHASGDLSVLALVLFDAQARAYLHDLLYLKTNSDNAAQAQCQMVAAFAQRHGLKQLHIEGNGLGQFLPGLLRQELRTLNYACAVLPIHNSRAKTQRILDAFEVRLAAKALSAHNRIKHTPFFDEMRDWRPNQPNARDDGLDAVAGALLGAPAPHTNHTKQFFIRQDREEDCE